MLFESTKAKKSNKTPDTPGILVCLPQGRERECPGFFSSLYTIRETRDIKHFS